MSDEQESGTTKSTSGNDALQALATKDALVNPAKTEAMLLVASVKAAMLNGVVHTSIKTGKVLTTADEIIMGMMESSIQLDDSKRVEVTTTLNEYKKLAAQWAGVED